MVLKKKILIGYGVAFALTGAVVAWAVWHLVLLGQASSGILRENYRSILAAENMVDAIERQDSAVLMALFGEAEKGLKLFRDSEVLFLQWLARARDNITIEGEADLVQTIEDDYEKYLLFSDFIRQQAENRLPFAAQKNEYQDSVEPLFARIRDTCIQLRNLNEETMYDASVWAGGVAQKAIWSTAIVAAAGLLIALVSSLLLSDRIARPIRRFMEASRKIASGDYGIQVPVETADELGHLAAEFNQMAAKLAHYHEMNIEQIIGEKQKGEAILASIEDGLVVLDTGLKITDINPAARSLLDLGIKNYLSARCLDILPDQKLCDLIRKTAETGTPPNLDQQERIITINQGSDHPRHCLFSVTPIRGKEGTFSGIVLLLRDVTRLKEVERLKSEFVMAASHELRTPLTSIEMSVGLLHKHAAEKLEPKERELLQAAHEEVQHLKALVNDLLDLSRIEAGKIDLEFADLSVSALVEKIKAIFKNQLEEKSVELSIQMEPDLPKIRADANKITWVLTNLISNALRYVSHKGHIQISAKRIGAQVYLSVQDNGPGIPPEYQSKIFQKFVQMKGRETGGTGLGLAICKEIVRAHGGAIWVESTPDKGSAFNFTVPAAAEEE